MANHRPIQFINVYNVETKSPKPPRLGRDGRANQTPPAATMGHKDDELRTVVLRKECRQLLAIPDIRLHELHSKLGCADLSLLVRRACRVEKVKLQIYANMPGRSENCQINIKQY